MLKKYSPSPAGAELAVRRLFFFTHLARVTTVSADRVDGMCFFLLLYRIIAISGYFPSAVLESSSVERGKGIAGVGRMGAHLERFQRGHRGKRGSL